MAKKQSIMRWKIKKIHKQKLRLKKQLKRYPENAAAIRLQIEALNWKENDLVARNMDMYC